MSEVTRGKFLIGTLVAGVLVAGAGNPASAFAGARGRQLWCVTDTNCSVLHMPLMGQCGGPSDAVDGDVQFACGGACATTSHNMLLSAAYANRTITDAYPSAARSYAYFGLPTGNANGRNSWIMRENSKNNGSYYTANGLTPPATTYPAYSLQNAVADFMTLGRMGLYGPPSLSPPGCNINEWWSCQVADHYGRSWWDYEMTNNTTINNNMFKTNQDQGYVGMVSFYHQTLTVYNSGISTFLEYSLVNRHKVAVNGYSYTADLVGTYALRINDPGPYGGLTRFATLAVKYADVVPTYVSTPNGQILVHQTVVKLPYGGNSFPYLKFSDDGEFKFLEGLDYIALF